MVQTRQQVLADISSSWFIVASIVQAANHFFLVVELFLVLRLELVDRPEVDLLVVARRQENRVC